MDEAGEITARQTVPTQQPIKIPAGRYQMRIAGDGRLSKTYQLRLERGESPKIALDLDERLLGLPVPVPETHRIVKADGRALVVTLSDEVMRVVGT